MEAPGPGPNAQPPVMAEMRGDAPPGAEERQAAAVLSTSDTTGVPEAIPEPARPTPPLIPLSTRRRFLRWLGGLTVVSSGAMVLTPIIGFLIPTSSSAGSNGGKVLVGTTDDIPPGGGKVVAMGSKPAIVVNTDGGVKAYSAICTHLGCVVGWNDMQSLIVCPCHGGQFSPSSGAVVGGPPPTPLPPINVSVEGNQIFLTES